MAFSVESKQEKDGKGNKGSGFAVYMVVKNMTGSRLCNPKNASLGYRDY